MDYHIRCVDGSVKATVPLRGRIQDAKPCYQLRYAVKAYHAQTRKDSSTDFVGVDFRNASLSGMDLRGARFCRADLTGAGCHNALLAGADFRDATLVKTDFDMAELTRARFVGANLRNATLRGAELCNAELHDVNLAGADFGRDWCLLDVAVPSLHRQILARLEADGRLGDQRWSVAEQEWRGMGQSRGGWSIVLAGKAGLALEFALGPYVAAALIYLQSCPAMKGYVPNFYPSDYAAELEDIKRLAALEPELPVTASRQAAWLSPLRRVFACTK